MHRRDAAVLAEGRHPLLESIDGRLVVVDVADAAGRILPDRGPQRWLERLAESVHEAYLREQLAKGAVMGEQPALREWKNLDEGLRESNRHQVRDFPSKLRQVGATVAPRSALAPPFAFHLVAQAVPARPLRFQGFRLLVQLPLPRGRRRCERLQARQGRPDGRTFHADAQLDAGDREAVAVSQPAARGGPARSAAENGHTPVESFCFLPPQD